jgi:hypothetical protein
LFFYELNEGLGMIRPFSRHPLGSIFQRM